MPKGLQLVGARRIIDRIAEALSGVTSDIRIVSNASDAADWIPGLRVIADAREERGSLVGIHSALVDAGEPVLVVAWDMPFVTNPLFRLIRDSLGDAAAAVPDPAAGLQPLCALYTPACLPTIEAALDVGDLRVIAMVERLPSLTRIPAATLATIADNPRRLFFNVNTAADLAEAERQASA